MTVSPSQIGRTTSSAEKDAAIGGNAAFHENTSALVRLGSWRSVSLRRPGTGWSRSPRSQWRSRPPSRFRSPKSGERHSGCEYGNRTRRKRRPAQRRGRSTSRRRTSTRVAQCGLACKLVTCARPPNNEDSVVSEESPPGSGDGAQAGAGVVALSKSPGFWRLMGYAALFGVVLAFAALTFLGLVKGGSGSFGRGRGRGSKRGR